VTEPQAVQAHMSVTGGRVFAYSLAASLLGGALLGAVAALGAVAYWPEVKAQIAASVRAEVSGLVGGLFK
jgi:ribulose kinase